MSPPELCILLLGSPRVEWHGEKIDIPRRAVRALLYRLAADEHPVSRDHLCLLFWREKDQATARRNLSHLLTHLRRALPQPEMIQSVDESVALNAEQIWCDARAFLALVQPLDLGGALTRETASARRRLVLPVERLEQAVSLYRGAFLESFSLDTGADFEAWILSQQQFYERLFLECLAGLIEAYQARQDIQAAIACGQCYLALDELAEDIHVKLIQLYGALGDRNAVQHQFEACLTVLERELNVSPLPETWVAYQQALKGRLATEKERPERADRAVQLPEAPLVGRDAALAALRRAFDVAQRGQSRVVLISGEQGIGKSRLMRTFTTQVQGRATILSSDCRLGVHTLPFQPLAEALRGWLGRPSPVNGYTRLPDLEPIWLAEVSRLLPELRSGAPDLPTPLSAQAEEARTRLFEALCRFVFALPEPLLLCMDDLHWSDASTLEWLAYLGGRLTDAKPPGVLLIGAYRSEEVDLLESLRLSLSNPSLLIELPLEQLEEVHTLQLLRHQFGAMASERELAAQLCRMCGGNPFFLLETINAVAEAGIPSAQEIDLSHLPLPKTVREAIRQRLVRLKPEQRQVLEAAAVLGMCFHFDTLRATSGRSEMETLDVLDILVERKLLDERGNAYEFRHEQVRSAVYSQLSHWRQRLLHRRAARALQSLQPDDAATLAWHFERGGEYDQAARYAMLAGERLTDIFAYAETRQFYTHALELLQRAADGLQQPQALVENKRLRVQALAKLSRVHRLLGDMGSYQRDLAEEKRLAEQLDDPLLLANVCLREVAAHRWYCRYLEARASAQTVLQLSREAGIALLEARAWRELGLAARATGDFGQAEQELLHALDGFTRLGEAVYEVHTLGNLCTLYCYMGQPERSLELAQRALERCEQAGLPFHRRLPLGDMGAACAALEDYAQGRACLLESLEIARQIADRTQEIFCLNWLGWLELRAGNQVDALGILNEGLALAERLNSPAEQSRLNASLAEVYHVLGDGVQARRHARRALELARAHQRAHDLDLAQKLIERFCPQDKNRDLSTAKSTPSG